MPGISRRADLIEDDAQFGAFLAQFQHGFDKIVAKRRKHPGSAYHHRAFGVKTQHRLIAGTFAESVSTFRFYRIILEQGAVQSIVINIIC